VIGGYLELARLHAPVLTVLSLFVGAALAMISPSRRLAWFLAIAGAGVAALFSVDAAVRVLVLGDVVVGTIEGVALRIDGVSLFGAAALCAASVLVAIAAGAFIAETPSRTGPYVMALLLCVVAGWCGALFASDALGMFAGAEIAWLASVAIVALSSERGALNGALRMLIAGGVASALFLIGAALLWRALGSTDLFHLSAAVIRMPGLAAIGVGLMLAALAVKAAAAPLNFWLGAAIGRASGVAVLALGVLGLIGCVFVIVRFAAHAAPAPALGGGVSAVLAALGAASVVIGSVQAVGARNLRRLAAYACVAQCGVALLCAALGSPAGFAAALVQAFATLAAILALFMGGAIGVGNARSLDALDGMGRRAPLAGVAITASAISLMGAPLTLGFLGRWRLVEAGVGAGWWWAAGAVIVTSLAGVFYGGRLIERLYFRRAVATHETGVGAWGFAGAPAMICAIVAICIGFAPGLLLRAADAATAFVAGGGP
jgi:multicomponent Na+:H+ antiporter subunit D